MSYYNLTPRLEELIEYVGGTIDGVLPACVWPGGYPIIYLDGESNTLCPTCATKSLWDGDERENYRPVAADVYYEGPTLSCDQCSREIESAYGDPEEEEEGMTGEILARD